MKTAILFCLFLAGCNQGMEPTAVDFGDSASKGYAVQTRHFLCGSVDFRHAPFDKGDVDLCVKGEPRPSLLAQALVKEDNNGCAETELANMKDELSGKHYNVLVFNAGLHDFQTHRAYVGACGESTPAEFHAAVEQLAKEAEQHADIVIWSDATPVPEGWWSLPEGIETVINPIGEDIAREHGFYILNWDSKYQIPHNVHYTQLGYEYLGKQLAACVQAALSQEETDRCHR